MSRISLERRGKSRGSTSKRTCGKCLNPIMSCRIPPTDPNNVFHRVRWAHCHDDTYALRGPERDHLTSSTSHPHEVFDTSIGKVGMLICWDLAFPEAFRELIAAGAKIIIIPTFWTLNDCNKEGLARNPASEALFLDSMLTARAFENTCAIVFANAGGPPGKGYAGLSQVSGLPTLLADLAPARTVSCFAETAGTAC